MMLQPLACPSCGAPFAADAAGRVFTCAFCGASALAERRRVPAARFRASLERLDGVAAGHDDVVSVAGAHYRVLGRVARGESSDVFAAERARQLTEQLLRGIRTNRARVVVIDITGVPAIDSTVANHLVQTVDASRLMGASVIITGLSSEIAQTLVTLGVDLSKVNAVGDLQGGIEEAERLLGYTVISGAVDKADDRV